MASTFHPYTVDGFQILLQSVLICKHYLRLDPAQSHLGMSGCNFSYVSRKHSVVSHLGHNG